MGTAKSKEKQRKIDRLAFYETSDYHWVFGNEHFDAIKEALQKVYLGKSYVITKSFNLKRSRWNHPNYTAFIHVPGTPLDKDTSSLCDDWQMQMYFKVGIFGISGVGKTQLAAKFLMHHYYADHSYTRHFSVGVPKEEYDGPCHIMGTHQATVDILDSIGLDQYRGLQHGWMMNTQIFFLVFSVVDKSSFEELERLRKMAVEVREKCWYPIITVGNKCDLRETGKFHPNAVDMDEVFGWCNEHKLPYIEISAKEGKNVGLLFRHSVWEYRWRLLNVKDKPTA